jgi:hypothetical protein
MLVFLGPTVQYYLTIHTSTCTSTPLGQDASLYSTAQITECSVSVTVWNNLQGIYIGKLGLTPFSRLVDCLVHRLLAD